MPWLREQVEATLLLPWHLPECQMLKPVPPNWPAFLGGSLSCNCDLTAERLSAYEAHTAILDLHQPANDKPLSEGHAFAYYCKTCGSGEPNEYPMPWPCSTLHALALAYKHRPGYRVEWRR